MADILIIDDDIQICKAIGGAVAPIGHHIEFAHELNKGVEEISRQSYDIVFLDVHLPDGNGLNALSKISALPPNPEVIIITGEGEPEGAELAITSGAWDYIEKPLSVKSITLALIRALQYREEKNKVTSPLILKRDSIIGESSQIRNCLNQVAQSAESNINVLITGETGTGKERFATAIHENSNRSEKNFMIVDCATLPETLVESVLFGHVRGSFTGAERAQEGLIKLADRGTLFLDEIGELPLSIQKAFLRVLQEHRFRPIGGKAEIESDFRLIAATNRDLDQMVKDGKFREDLLFRIRSMTIDIPPLKDRLDDIEELVTFYINKLCVKQGIYEKNLSPELTDILKAYHWPGNVRELINTLDEAISKARHEPTLFPKHLPDNIRIKVAKSSLRVVKPKKEGALVKKLSVPDELPPMKEFRESVIAENERLYLEKLLSVTNGNINEACRISELGRSRLYGLMKIYGISKAV